MLATLEKSVPQGNGRSLLYSVRLPDVVIHAGLSCGPAPKAGNRFIWSLSLAARADFDFDDKVILQIKKLLLPHVPLTVCGVTFTSCGRLMFSLVQSERMPFAGN